MNELAQMIPLLAGKALSIGWNSWERQEKGETEKLRENGICCWEISGSLRIIEDVWMPNIINNIGIIWNDIYKKK